MTKITKRVIDSTNEFVFLRDSDIRGFGVKITRTAKSFFLERRINGRVRRTVIGRYPDLTVDQARRKAQEWVGKIALGEDPTQEKADRKNELIFKELAKIYIERHAKAHKKTWEKDEKRIEIFLSHWNNRKLSSISRDEVARLHQTVGEKNGRYEANRLVDLIRPMWNLGKTWGYISEEAVNPGMRIQRFREIKRDRFLSKEELKEFFKVLEQEPNPYWQAFFLIALLLGARRSEILSAKWEHIDFNASIWRFPITKSGNSHVIPLSEVSIEILKRIPRKKDSPFLFPSIGRTGHLVEPKKIFKNLLTRAKLKDVRIHDLRRTLGSHLAMEGASLLAIGKVLNHKSLSSTQVYARLSSASTKDVLNNHSLMLEGIRKELTKGDHVIAKK